MQVITLFLAFILIFLPSSSWSCPTSSVDDDFVYDTKGNPLVYGDFYNMTGGPFCGKVDVWYRNNGSTCRLDLLQHYFRLISGAFFKFTPKNASLGGTPIRLGSPLSISSPTRDSLCLSSSFWKVTNDSGIPYPIITIGGSLNAPNSCFRIVKATDPPIVFIYTYVIEHCPFLCGGGGPIKCYPVGIYETSDNYKHLSNRPAEGLKLIFDRINPPSLINII